MWNVIATQFFSPLCCKRCWALGESDDDFRSGLMFYNGDLVYDAERWISVPIGFQEMSEQGKLCYQIVGISGSLCINRLYDTTKCTHATLHLESGCIAASVFYQIYSKRPLCWELCDVFPSYCREQKVMRKLKSFMAGYQNTWNVLIHTCQLTQPAQMVQIVSALPMMRQSVL